MTKPRIINVPFTFKAKFTPKRSRKAADAIVAGTAPIALRVASETEAPLSFRVSADIYRCTPDDAMFDLRSTEDGHWRPLPATEGAAVTLRASEALSRMEEGVLRLGSGLAKVGRPAESFGEGVFSDSDRDQVVRGMQAAADEFLIVGDAIYRPCSEPVWEFETTMGGKTYARASSLSQNHSLQAGGSVLPANRLDRIRDALGIAVDADDETVKLSLWGSIEVLRADCVRYRHDEEPRFRKTLSEIIPVIRNKLARDLDHLSPQLLSAYHELREKTQPGLGAAEAAEALRAFLPLVDDRKPERWLDNEDNWEALRARAGQALEDWNRYMTDVLDEAAIGAHLRTS